MNNIKEQGLLYLHCLADSKERELSGTDIDKINRLLHSKSAETRYLATVVAGLYYDSAFEEALIDLLRDWRLMIRVNACDSLSNSANIAVCKHIIPLMHRCRRLERGYAMLSYSDIIENSGASKEQALRILRARIAVEKNTWVKVTGIESIAQLGEKDVLEQLYPYLTDEQPHVRRLAIKCSNRFLSDMDQEKLLLILKEQRLKEIDESITTQIDSLLEGLAAST